MQNNQPSNYFGGGMERYRDEVEITPEELNDIIARNGWSQPQHSQLPENSVQLDRLSLAPANDASAPQQAVVEAGTGGIQSLETVSGFLRPGDPMSVSESEDRSTGSMNPGSHAGSLMLSNASSLPRQSRNVDYSTVSMDTDSGRQGGGGLNSSTMNDMLFFNETRSMQ